MNSNNYLSNKEPRLPTRVTKAVGDVIAGIELQAAHVAKGAPAESEIEQHMAQLIRLVDDHRPDKSASLKKNMIEPLTLANRHRRFSSYRNISDSLNKVRQFDVALTHKESLTAIATNWAHIPPEVTGAHLLGNNKARDVLIPQSPNRGLRFYLAKVMAIDETGGGLFGEIGKDEIYCGAVAVDEDGDTSSGGLFKVGNFDDGDVRDYGYPGKQLQYFNLNEGGNVWPKHYTVAVSLVEHDFGDLPAWFDRLLDLVRTKVTELIAAATGALAGTWAGPIGSLIGAAVGWAIGKLIKIVKSWLGDENLGTKTIMATINGRSGNWIGSGGAVSNLYTRDYRAHSGHYRIWWRCELVR